MDCCERSVTAGGAPSTSTASQTTATWLAPGMHPRHAADRGPTTFMRCKVRTTGILLCPIPVVGEMVSVKANPTRSFGMDRRWWWRKKYFTFEDCLVVVHEC